VSSKAYTVQSDKRVDLSGATVGQATAPDSLITNPGSIGARAGDFSQVSQQITGNRFRIGMTGAEVKDLLVQVGETSSSNLNAVKDFAASSLTQVAAAQSGRTTDWQQYIPLIAIGLVAYAAVRRRSP
jgi:hypothetical protein